VNLDVIMLNVKKPRNVKQSQSDALMEGSKNAVLLVNGQMIITENVSFVPEVYVMYQQMNVWNATMMKRNVQKMKSGDV